MQKSYLEFVPFPYVYEGEKRDGLILEWPQKCKECQRDNCFDAKFNQYGVCSFGFNYIRISPSLILGGFLLKEYNAISAARNKRLRTHKDFVVNKQRLDSFIERISSFEKSLEEEIEAEKTIILNEYICARTYEDDFLRGLDGKLKEAFSSLHDFKQFAAQVSQNINVVIETRYEGKTLEDKLKKATHSEVAIYWLSKMMDSKLMVSKFVAHPEKIDLTENQTVITLHSLVLKYLRIYEMNFRAKGIQPHVVGKSFGKILCNPEAVGVIVHTFIDNAYKYTPKNQNVELSFSEDDEQIEFGISSYGPLVTKKEKDKIFQPFERAKAAKEQEEDGSGYGLFVSSVIANRHNARIDFYQNTSNNVSNKYFWTTFKVTFERQG